MSAAGRIKHGVSLARYLIEAAFFFVIIGFFRLFRVDTASAIGAWCGRTLLSRSHPSQRARENLIAAYPQMGVEQREQIIREMWDNLGRNIAEYAHLGKLSIRGTHPRIALANMQNYENAVASGSSIICVSAHFANWEVLPLAAAQYGVEGGAVYRPVNNPFVDSWLVRQRRRNGPKEQIAKGAQGTRRIFTLLRACKAIFMLVDQKTNEGLAVPFFGRDAMTTPAPAALALKLGAVLLPISNERIGGARFRVTVHPAIEFVPSGEHARDVLMLTTRINEAIEACVRYRPSQWLWIHRRWPKPGERPRSRRGREALALTDQMER
ncbi:MAG TPA: lysophospholipid acyltransferase family protein [Rhizomicrobium sp.]|jgi:KDO2-lipid IV(A) lauroyltransferase|nr:lysophospholipid acyltransferase family protein [Rhizomicrobium sp.]